MPALAALPLDELRKILPPSRILTDELTLSVYARDASLYRILPQVVLKVENEIEMSQVLALAYAKSCPVGFRAAGTSLSGQALTHGMLILQGDGWREIEILERGSLVRVGPGWRGAEVNAQLKPYHRKIGPDPASLEAAKIGGIAANNASGMCCGTQQNTYQTMQGCKIIFSDGCTLDTNSEASRRNFRQSHGEILAGIEALGEQLRCRPEWVEMIRHKYLLKNTTGYSLNSFLDYADPIDVIAHLMVGSEGTLGFIADITYRTVVEYPYKSNALVFFDNIYLACQAVQALRDLEVKAIELMDTQALYSVQNQLPAGALAGASVTALLIEIQASKEADLAQMQRAVQGQLQDFMVEVNFTQDTVAYNQHWKIRKGMFPSVAAMREKEETVIIEDIAIPVDRLAEGTVAVQRLFKEAGYTKAIIFGHAQAGNLHIVFTQAFETENHKQRYQILMDKLSDLVVNDYAGSLKAEHGTGRNMAPYVKKEWGAELYEIMKALKNTLDPHQILNPGVVISDDAHIHLKNIKSMPAVHELIDGCMECGFCERVCPSKDLSLTPRGRISALREMKSQGKSLQSFAQGEVVENMQYQAVDTCATDGMCGEVCPVKINTGQLVKVLRESGHSPRQRKIANMLARHQNKLEAMARGGLAVYHALAAGFGYKVIHAGTNALHRWSHRRIPHLRGKLPRPAMRDPLDRALSENARIPQDRCMVIYQSCLHRVFGSHASSSNLPDVTTSLVALATKLGYRVLLGSHAGQCCGLPYSSKGFTTTAESKLNASLKDLQKLTQEGRWPVMVDNSPCSQELKAAKTHLKILDAVEWLDQASIGVLDLQKSNAPMTLHTTCSARKMGLQAAHQRLVSALTTQVIQPEGLECCGFAGDRGFSHPELNESALNSSGSAFGINGASGVTSSTTCGLGLEWNSGRPYPHLAQVLNAASEKSSSSHDVIR